jgi:hypothetical protein
VAVHEIGHTHGRDHAPCGIPDAGDLNFPHAGAALGTWGYDLVNKKLIDPSKAKDVMSYCSPVWTSDYTFVALFDRMKSVNKAKINLPLEKLNRTYNRMRIAGDGTAIWQDPITLELPPVGFETKSVTVQTKTGTQTIVGEWYPYDHISGGALIWPATESPATTIKVTIKGKDHILQR